LRKENDIMTHQLLSRSVTRRQFAGGAAAGAAALALLPAPALFAAQATPTADFASLGYPELKVTITDTGFEGIPDTLTAGRYLLTATAKTSGQASPDQQPPTVAFVSPTPAGMSAADFMQALAGPPASASPAAGATPAAGGEQGGGEEQQLPLFIYQMKLAGGTLVLPGQTAQVVIDLTAGEWLAWGDDPSSPLKPVVFKVTGDFPADVKDPEADITATLIDFAIQLEGNLTAGKHVIKVQHHGAQPHFLELDKGPDTMTKEMVQAALAGEMSGTPAANGISDNELQPIFYSPTQSIGTTTWHQVDLPAGTYLAACFFPTAGTGVPHAMNGMIDVVKITG
jgi:hypothetical protein